MNWLLKQARIGDDAPLVDIAIQAGTIAAIQPSDPAALQPGAITSSAENVWDLDGRVVLPGLIDAHTHLDKTYIDAQNQSGTLLEAIDVWRQIKHGRTPDQIRATVRRALRNAVANGVTAMRSHIDTDEEKDLRTLEIILDLRDEFRTYLDLQLVALGWAGCTRENDEILRGALDMGVDAVGGAPALTPDPQHSVDVVFQLAQKYGKPVDLHVDETEDPQMCTLAYSAEQTIAHGMQGQVTAGHCCSLAFIDATTANPVMDRVATAGMHVVTLPSCNLVLMGRSLHPVPRGVTRVKELLQRGVNVCAASDNVHDPFNPFGSYDLLHIAHLSAHVSHLTGLDELYTALAMVTDNPIRLMQGQISDDQLKTYAGLAPGAVADLVILDSRHVLDAITAPPIRLGTFKAGQLVVRTEINRIWTYGECG